MYKVTMKIQPNYNFLGKGLVMYFLKIYISKVFAKPTSMFKIIELQIDPIV